MNPFLLLLFHAVLSMIYTVTTNKVVSRNSTPFYGQLKSRPNTLKSRPLLELVRELVRTYKVDLIQRPAIADNNRFHSFAKSSAKHEISTAQILRGHLI